MNNNAALGEILYIISNYYKGKIDSSKLIWGKEYRSSLGEALDIMNLIVCNIGADSQMKKNEIDSLYNFIIKNIGTVFIKPKVNLEDIPCILLDGTENEILTKKQLQIQNIMSDILHECKELLFYKKRNYKKKIKYLLMALHNLPMVYVKPQKNRIFGVNIFEVRDDEALSYAESYSESKNSLN